MSSKHRPMRIQVCSRNPYRSQISADATSGFRNPQQQFISFRHFAHVSLYSLLIVTFGLAIYALYHELPMTDTLSTTLCALDRDLGLNGAPLAMCSNLWDYLGASAGVWYHVCGHLCDYARVHICVLLFNSSKFFSLRQSIYGKKFKACSEAGMKLLRWELKSLSNSAM